MLSADEPAVTRGRREDLRALPRVSQSRGAEHASGMPITVLLNGQVPNMHADVHERAEKAQSTQSATRSETVLDRQQRPTVVVVVVWCP